MNDIREDLKAYIDDELTPERAAEVQAAIDQDPALREEYLFMKLLSGEIKSAAKQPQVAGVDKAVGKTAKSGPGFNLGRMALYVASGVASVMLIGVIFSPVFAQSKLAAKKTQILAAMIAKASRPAESTAGASPVSEGEVSKPGGGGGALKPEFGDDASTPSDSTLRGGAGEPAHGGFGGGKGADSDFAKKSVDKGGAYYERSAHSNGTIASGKTNGNVLDQKQSSPDLNRMVVRTANMGLKVKDVGKAMSDAETQIVALGGYVENTNFNQAEDASKGNMTFQVPEKNFDAIVDYLGKAGTIVSNNKTGKDVTGQYHYTKGQITSLADEEHNLIEELQRTKNSSDRLEIRSRLSSVRQEMQGLKEENAAVKDLADMSRFNVAFEKSGQLDEAKAGDWFNQTTSGAGDMLGFFGRIFGVGLIYTVFLAPIWLPVAGGIWWLRKRARANVAASE